MKRIRVPDELLSAVESEVNAIYCPTGATSVAVEAVLSYISEHPQVPTDEQWSQLFSDYADAPHGYPPIESQLRWTLDQWQRRCFVQEEPEIPAEIKDLLWSGRPFKVNDDSAEAEDVRIMEAYRRGVRKGEAK